MRFLPAGSGGLLIEVANLEQALALFGSLRRDPVEGVEELVPAARTVLVRFRPSLTDPGRIAAQVRDRRLTRATAEQEDGPLVNIPVHYDGEDLPDIARSCGLSEAEVVRRHTAATYSVAFTGFAPGFAYLAGGDPALRVPRRSSPRISIPAGAVGLAGEYSGVYPRASPGGWQLLGRTTVLMWDLDRANPALLQPGMRVQFVNAGQANAETIGPNSVEAATSQPNSNEPAEGGRALAVLSPGALSILEDLGRPGQSGLGVSRSGAMDHGALRRANRLVGNPSDAPALEVASGGLRVRARGDLVLALAGAPAGLAIEAPGGNRVVRAEVAFALDDGEVLTLGAPPRGVHSYLAVRGSFAVDRVLGSASGDVLSGIGPPPLQAGDVLTIGTRPTVGAVVIDASPAPPLPAAIDVVWLDIVLGPRADWCTPESVQRFTAQEWTVTPQSNRVGLRLQGKAGIDRSTTEELPSEATVAGAVQIPPSGQPVLFMADHPVTGGYPVIGCVAAHHLDLAAQVPVTGRIRFRVVTGFDDKSPDASKHPAHQGGPPA